jgi:hypothetical protein
MHPSCHGLVMPIRTLREKDIKGAVTGHVKNRIKSAFSAGGGKANEFPPAKKPVADPNAQPDATGTDADAQAAADEEAKKKAMMNKQAANNTSGLSREQVIALFPELQQMLANNKRAEEDEKRQLATKLVAHITDNSKKTEKFNSLIKQPVEALREFADMLPTNNQQSSNDNRVASYFGRTGVDDTIVDNKGLQDEILQPPVYNWDEIAKSNRN